MPQREPKETLMRSKEAWRIKDQWKSLIEECYDLALASISPYQPDNNQPRQLNQQFSSVAPAAVMKLANRILDELTPPHDDWIDVSAGPLLEMQAKQMDGGENQLQDLEKDLEDVSRFANMVANSGELVAARHMAYLDMLIAGFGCGLNLEDPYSDVAPVASMPVSQSEVALEKNERGQNIGIYRKRKIKVSRIQKLWDDATIPDAVRELMKGKDKDPEIEVLEVTYQNPVKVVRNGNIPAWSYEVLYHKDGTDPHVMVERGYNENPWFIFQWMTLPGSNYGPGPVLMALADIRVTNKIVQMILQNAALALAGMYLVKDDGVVNPDNIQITNGGMITVGATGGTGGASIAPLETGRSFDVGQLLLEQYEIRIKKWLYDNGLPGMDAAPRSATEIINRVRELTQDLGAGIGRLTGDHVEYVRRIIGILVRRGVIPFNVNIDQFTLKIQIASPLARAQQLQKVDTVIQWLQMVMQIGGQQALIITAKVPEIMVWVAEQMGVPMALVNNPAERAKAQADLAQITAAGAMPAAPDAALPAQA